MVLYYTCLRSCGKNFMKFGHTDWEISAFKVGNKSVFEHSVNCNFRWLRLPFVEYFCTMDFELKNVCIEELSWKSMKKFQKKYTWFSFFKKWLSRSRFKIERKTKSLNSSKMGLKHNNSNNEIVLARKLNLSNNLFWKIVKTAFKNESYKLFYQKDA